MMSERKWRKQHSIEFLSDVVDVVGWGMCIDAEKLYRFIQIPEYWFDGLQHEQYDTLQIEW